MGTAVGKVEPVRAEFAEEKAQAKSGHPAFAFDVTWLFFLQRVVPMVAFAQATPAKAVWAATCGVLYIAADMLDASPQSCLCNRVS